MTTLPSSGTWTVDPSATSATFAVNNFYFNTVTGTLAVRRATIEADPDGRPVSITAVLDAASIATGNARRDADLRGSHFLDASAHPELVWRCSRIHPDKTGWSTVGSLLVADQDAPLELSVETAPTVREDAVRVVARGTLDRVDAGIRAPRLLIGRLVHITVEAVLVPSAVTARVGR